jgi:hypothetical protein
MTGRATSDVNQYDVYASASSSTNPGWLVCAQVPFMLHPMAEKNASDEMVWRAQGHPLTTNSLTRDITWLDSYPLLDGYAVTANSAKLWPRLKP